MAKPIKPAEDGCTIDQLFEEFVARCRVRNLSNNTIEWYHFKLAGFTRWCSVEGITQAGVLTSRDLARFLASEPEASLACRPWRG